jgi:hypothetical protein
LFRFDQRNSGGTTRFGLSLSPPENVEKLEEIGAVLFVCRPRVSTIDPELPDDDGVLVAVE